jgi:gliding motility-associated lipoprotein GldJ
MMHTRRAVFLAATCSALLALGSCKNSASKNESRATGWSLNDKNSPLSHPKSSQAQKTGPGLVFVEGGSFVKGRVQDDIMRDWNNTPTQQHVQSFYMDETEVTNSMYLEFLEYIKAVYPPSNPKYDGIYQSALPDTLVWRNRLSYNEDLVENYLRHPAFADFPVVGVSWLQAQRFAQWRTNRVNELLLEENGFLEKDARFKPLENEMVAFDTEAYLKNPNAAYGGAIDSLARRASRDTIPSFAKLSDGVLLPAYRLPTETEWEYAAQAPGSQREFNNYKGRKKFPWEGNQTRDTDRRVLGDQLANFKKGKGDYGGIAGWSEDGGSVTTPVKMHPANDFGLYGMGGNVAEWVADVYRPIIDSDYSDFNYYRGNVFQKAAIGKDGKVAVLQEGIEFDTLPNGKLSVKRLPGEVVKVPVGNEDTFMRFNYSESDNRNFNDGDLASSRGYNRYNEENTDKNRMYNAPKPLVARDSTGGLILEYDKSNNRSSMITNDVRVYKGASWKDRAYWLDPAQRRYMPEYMSTDFIGFRCAMSYLGSKPKSLNRTPKSKTAKK